MHKPNCLASIRREAENNTFFFYSKLILHFFQPSFKSLSPSIHPLGASITTKPHPTRTPALLSIPLLTYLHSFPGAPAVSDRITGFAVILSTVHLGNHVKLLFVQRKIFFNL